MARAANLLRTQAQQPSERRRFRRLPLEVDGRLQDAVGLEHHCRTLNLSPGDACITTPAILRVGDKIIMYLNEVGRVEADVLRADPEDRSFGLRFRVGRHKLERHVDILMGMMYPWARDADARRTPRTPGAGMADVRTASGRVIACQVVDISTVGVGLATTAPRPLLGEWVFIAGKAGRVARYFDGGFAIDLRPASDLAAIKPGAAPTPDKDPNLDWY